MRNNPFNPGHRSRIRRRLLTLPRRNRASPPSPRERRKLPRARLRKGKPPHSKEKLVTASQQERNLSLCRSR